jgi:hypothetical protein
LLAGATGCYERRYESRVQTTVRLYEHFDELNSNLDAKWSGDGLELRVPKRFTYLPPPAPPVVEPPADGQPAAAAAPAEPVLDERQPDYLGIELPGLVGAWRISLPASNADGSKNIELPGFLYLMTNQHLFRTSSEVEPNRTPPEEFQGRAVSDIAAALETRVDESGWVAVTYPEKFDLVPKVAYQSLVLRPEKLIADNKYNFDLYCTTKGDLQVIAMFVIPDGVAPSENLANRIKLCLETLRITADRPGAASSSGSGSGGNTGGPPAGF